MVLFILPNKNNGSIYDVSNHSDDIVMAFNRPLAKNIFSSRKKKLSMIHISWTRDIQVRQYFE